MGSGQKRQTRVAGLAGYASAKVGSNENPGSQPEYVLQSAMG